MPLPWPFWQVGATGRRRWSGEHTDSCAVPADVAADPLGAAYSLKKATKVQETLLRGRAARGGRVKA